MKRIFINTFLVILIALIVWFILSHSATTGIDILETKQKEPRVILDIVSKATVENRNNKINNIIYSEETYSLYPEEFISYAYCSSTNQCSRLLNEEEISVVQEYFEYNEEGIIAVYDLDKDDNELDIWVLQKNGEIDQINNDIGLLQRIVHF